MKRALVTGVTGQDGSFLVEHLIDMGYEVWGLVRKNVSIQSTIDLLKDRTSGKLNICIGDMTSPSSLIRAVEESRPDEIYNLAAQSHVGLSFKPEMTEYTGEVNAIGVMSLLEAARSKSPEARFYQASTSELFGLTPPPQNENSVMHPRSPYGFAKLYAYWAVVNMRESVGMFSSNGILFNHESERRGETFVTRKITKAISRISLGLQSHLELGNLDAKRDWGYAKDYIKAMHLILQADEPDDFVISTGEAHSVRDFLERAFHYVGIEIESNGESGVDEVYFRKDTGDPVVKINKDFYRKAEVDYLLGDSSKARKVLGWKPEVSFDGLVDIMMSHDLDMERQNAK
jgi:GDPmannose 4,6-dehydratase